MSQHFRLLEPAQRHLHDPGRRMHARLPVLRGHLRPAGGVRSRGAAASRRVGGRAGFAARGHHVSRPRRPPGRRGRDLRPHDPQHPPAIPGVALTKIETRTAGPACEDAIRQYPNLARFPFQAGRVALAAKDHALARQQFEKAFDDFVPERVAGFGEKKPRALLRAPIFRNEQKIRACIENGRRWTKRAREQGTYYPFVLPQTIAAAKIVQGLAPSVIAATRILYSF